MTYLPTKQDAIAYGLEKETEYFPIIKQHFGSGCKKTTDKFHPYDFTIEGTNRLAELKSRTIPSTLHDKTFFTYHKVVYAKAFPEYEYHLYFAFPDGVYYTPLTDDIKALPKEYLPTKYGRRSGVFIPMTWLNKIA